MAMDDPWGSPWADDIQHDIPIKVQESSQEDGGLKARVDVPLGEGGGLDTWGTDDDGFGEWASLPMDDGTAEEARGLDDENDGWGARHTEEDRGLTNGGLDGNSISWEDHASRDVGDITGLSPTLLPKHPEVVRQHSPDPWSTETILNNGAYKDSRREGERRSHNFLIDETTTVDTSNHLSSIEAPPSAKEEAPHSTDNIKHEGLEVADTIQKITPIQVIDDVREKNVDLKDDQNNKDIEVDHQSSRPSSSPSDHEGILPDSPRTSLDEEPKRPSLPRKVSSKVQELVQHFDDLGKAEVVDEELDLKVSHPKEEDPAVEAQEADNDDDEFGDFEDGGSEVGEPEAQQVKSTEPVTVRQDPDGTNSKAQSPPASPPKPVTKKDFGRVRYTSDTTAFEKLYPDTKEESPGEVFIPDVIPQDSFSTVEERKTWYRISRYGTTQKHNTGDDDSYVRVNWAQSQIRTETLQIVARWMEEDRMSGRVVLGGGSKGSSLFGWNDPNAAPVPLAAAFAENPTKKKLQPEVPVHAEAEIPREWPKGLARHRSTSKNRSPPKMRRRTSSSSRRSSSEVKAKPQLAASFGWNSAQEASRPQTSLPLAPKIEIPSSNTISPPRQSSVFSAPALSPIFSPAFAADQTQSLTFRGSDAAAYSSKTSPSILALAPDTQPSQDDDWGEMVSSPVHMAPPVLSPSQDPRHKKTQSLIGPFSNVLQPSSTTNNRLPSVPPSQGHKSVPSLDELLAPKTRMSDPQISSPMSLGIFDPIQVSSSISNIAQPPLKVNPTPVTNGGIDPWASADFSFFDTPPAPAPPSQAISTPVIKAVSGKSVAFSETPPAVPRGNGRSKLEVEQDSIVASIVKNLPDLSYMLRR